MILAIDVHYTGSTAVVAGVLFQDWTAGEPLQQYTSFIEHVAQYESGQFYKRELPCLLTLIREHELQLDCVVIDGYVFLDGQTRPGLGKHLFNALDSKVSVIGVAKTAFDGIGIAHKMYRGISGNPLYITTTGDLEGAKMCIAKMHGEFRLPTLLKLADSLCRRAMN